MQKTCKKCNKFFTPTKRGGRLCTICSSEYHLSWRDNNRKALHENARRWRARTKLDVLSHYSGTPPRCQCCGEKELVFLTIDHIDGSGREHRRQIGRILLTVWIKRNNYPPNFQVLCFNCNCGKSLNKNVCPHKNYTQKKS